MKSRILSILVTLLVFCAGQALAAPDLYIGDTGIYSGEITNLRPNVLFLVDNNSTMGNSAAIGDPYNPATTYAGSYTSTTVYKVTGMSNYVSHIADVNSITCTNAKTSLLANGSYSGASSTGLKSNGTCGNGGANLTYLGNLLNYNSAGSSAATQSQVEIVRKAVLNVAEGSRNAVNIGVMSFGRNKSGGRVLQKIGDISGAAAFSNFSSVLPGTPSTGEPLLSGNGRPLGESLYDAGAYFKGVYPIIGNDTSLSPYPSPIELRCQKNFVIVITNGDTDLDGSPKLDDTTPLGTVVGRDENGAVCTICAYGTGTHYMDDVAKFIYQNDLSALAGTQRVITHAVQVFSPYKDLVHMATDGAHGHGAYYVASDANSLSNALTQVMTNIVLESDTSFVAPVVPVSPENRTYSGSRVYMGFFKPISQTYWHGNMKKYGINNVNNLTDKNGNLACNVDNDGDNVDDNSGTALPSGTVNGSFKDSSLSFWSSAADGGSVENGGGGDVLLSRAFTSSTGGAEPRKIFTYTGSNTSLTDASNAFTTANTAINGATLGVADSAKDSLIDFVHGIDKYDENGNLNTTEKRGWLFGDILHSRPLIVSYATYTFTVANEANCATNKSIIFVGANDGMLHAVKDCDGTEAWSFIPPDMLPNLRYMTGTSHAYFVDATPSVYIYDKNRNGIIETDMANNDKVILLFGERRGGGSDAAPTGGNYYALDVSDPAAPKFLWSISNQKKVTGTTSTASTDYAELAETWSEPKIVKMKIGTAKKIVAFVGAGYDNIHEDTRYGENQNFTDAASVSLTELGNGNTVSGGSVLAQNLTNPRGRGVYAIEVATLDADGVPSFTDGGARIWGYVYGASTSESATPATNSLLKYSIPGELAAVDWNNDGYVDRLYSVDTGGRVWRFNVGDAVVGNWTATRLFRLHAGTTEVGRKFFYKPSVVVEPGYAMLFFGSGDREHPLNRHTALIDRFYALKDRGQTTADSKDETSLTDVTDDLLQTTTATSGATTVTNLLAALDSSYGWYIKLNENIGEKVLAPPTVFNKVAYFTTYTPSSAVVTDPCTPGNLGVSRLYAVDYKTGESVLNYDLDNDTTATTNLRAKSTPGKVMQRIDRVTTLGSGIPSGIVMLITPGGGLKALIGVGGIIAGEDPKKGGGVLPLYWRQK